MTEVINLDAHVLAKVNLVTFLNCSYLALFKIAHFRRFSDVIKVFYYVSHGFDKYSWLLRDCDVAFDGSGWNCQPAVDFVGMLR